MLRFLSSRRFWGAVLAGVSHALPTLTGGTFTPEQAVIGEALGAALYGVGAKAASDRIERGQQ